MSKTFIFRLNAFVLVYIIATLLFVSCGDAGSGNENLAIRSDNSAPNVTGERIGSIPEGPCKCINQKASPTSFVLALNNLNHFISLDQAVNMVKKFGTERSKFLKSPDQDVLPVYETFNLKAIDSLICSPEVMAIRIYNATDNGLKGRFVIVGVDREGKDVIQLKMANPAYAPAASSPIVEQGQRYP